MNYEIHVQVGYPDVPGERFHACADGFPEYRAYGDTVAEAIGNLILGYSTRLGCTFELTSKVKEMTGLNDTHDFRRR